MNARLRPSGDQRGLWSRFPVVNARAAAEPSAGATQIEFCRWSDSRSFTRTTYATRRPSGRYLRIEDVARQVVVFRRDRPLLLRWHRCLLSRDATVTPPAVGSSRRGCRGFPSFGRRSAAPYTAPKGEDGDEYAVPRGEASPEPVRAGRMRSGRRSLPSWKAEAPRAAGARKPSRKPPLPGQGVLAPDERAS